MYPFGFGLSYTTFAAQGLEASVRDGSLRLSVQVANTGDRAGEAPLQVYVGHASAAVATPVYALKAVRREALASGERRTVTLEIALEALSTVYEDGSKALETGAYEIYAGFNQPDCRSLALGGGACAHTTLRLDA